MYHAIVWQCRRTASMVDAIEPSMKEYIDVYKRQGLQIIKYMLPPYFYLTGSASVRLTGYLALYGLITFAAGLGLGWIFEKTEIE